MRSAKPGRRLNWKTALKVAVPVAVLSVLAAGCNGQNGPTASPATTSRVSTLEAQANTAATLLTTERAASSALSANSLLPPVDFCTNLTTQYGGTETSGTVSGTMVTIPSFAAPSTFGYDSKATALKGEQQTKRQWGDAINTALPLTQVGNKWQFTMSAVEASVCSEPDYAAQTILGLSSIEIGGVTVAHLNKWMSEGSPSPLKTVQWASQCMNGGFAVQAKCAQVMQDAAFMLTKFKPMGVHHDSPSWYFKLRNGLVVGSIPPIESVYGSYSGYFLEFQYTTKAGGCFLRLGVNVGRSKLNGGDQRLAGFLCDHPQAPAPAASSVPTTPTTSRTQPAPTPSRTHPAPRPSTSTPSTPPSTSPPTTAPPTTAPPTTPPPSTSPPTTPPTHCGCTSPPSSSPPTDCGCNHTPPPSETATPTPSETCGCNSTSTPTPSYVPSETPSNTYTPPATDTPSDTATPTVTPSPQCTCMDTVSQVQSLASKLGFTNIFFYGAYPPPGTKKGVTLAS